MAEITDTSLQVYRDFQVDGVPASGIKQPTKSEIRALFALIDSIVATLLGGHIGKTTQALLYADLDHPAGTIGEVRADPIAGVSVSRARTSNVATIIWSTAHGLSPGADINMRTLGGTGYNGHVTLISGTTGTTIKYASVGSNEGTTADTGGTADRTGYYLKQGDSPGGSWLWNAEINEVFAALARIAALEGYYSTNADALVDGVVWALQVAGAVLPLTLNSLGKWHLERDNEETTDEQYIGGAQLAFTVERGKKFAFGMVSDGFDAGALSQSFINKIGARYTPDTSGLAASVNVATGLSYAGLGQFWADVDGNMRPYLQLAGSSTFLADVRDGIELIPASGQSLRVGRTSTYTISNRARTSNVATLQINADLTPPDAPPLIGDVVPVKGVGTGYDGIVTLTGVTAVDVDTWNVTYASVGANEASTASTGTVNYPIDDVPPAPGYAKMFNDGIRSSHHIPPTLVSAGALNDFVDAYEQDADVPPTFWGETGATGMMYWIWHRGRSPLLSEVGPSRDHVLVFRDDGVGGYKISQLDKDATNDSVASDSYSYANFLTGLSFFVGKTREYGKTPLCRFDSWWHGNANDAAGDSFATQRAQLVQLITDRRTDIHAALGTSDTIYFVMQPPAAAGGHASAVGRQSALVHVDISRTVANCLISTPQYFMRTTDGQHLYPIWYKIAGEYDAKAWRSIFVKGVVPTGFRILTTSPLTGTGTTRVLHTEGRVGTMVEDNANVPAQPSKGFVCTGGSSPAINSVTLNSPSPGDLTFVFSADPTGCQLSYAWEQPGSSPPLPYFGALGNIHDSDLEPSYAGHPTYVTLPNWLQPFQIPVP